LLQCPIFFQIILVTLKNQVQKTENNFILNCLHHNIFKTLLSKFVNQYSSFIVKEQ
jgi:hypothetical protein